MKSLGRSLTPSRGRAAALAFALIAGACATERAHGPVLPPPPQPPVRVRPVEPPPPPPPPTIENDITRNRVALLVPMTGPQAPVGQSIANAALLALTDLHDARFRLTTYDTAGPGGARAAAQAAVAAHAGVILGPLLAGHVRDAAPIASAAGVPMLSFTNDAGVAGGGTYVMGFQPAQSIARVIGFARAHGVSRFAALLPAGVYGTRASTSFLRAVQANGGTVTGIATYTRDRKQLAAAARKVTNYQARLSRAGSGPGLLRPDGTVAPIAARAAPVPFQALLIADNGPIAAAFGPSLGQYGAAATKLLGTELWAAEPGLARVPALRGAWFAAVPDARFVRLAVRYRARYGSHPSRLASLGYDAVLLVQAAARNWVPGEPFPRAALADAGGFSGVDGAFRFGSSGIAERSLEVRQIGAGGVAVVSPAPGAF
jgi:branched-chain amino acid transport system substrate-binding protein